jgi:hypothetical protein
MGSDCVSSPRLVVCYADQQSVLDARFTDLTMIPPTKPSRNITTQVLERVKPTYPTNLHLDLLNPSMYP